VKVHLTPIEGLWQIENEVFSDLRGSFSEIFQAAEFRKQTSLNFMPAQWNQSVSSKGVLRGIHYSLAPEGQSKWVNCSAGSILDIVIDLRRNSKTFLSTFEIELTSDNRRSLVIGPGLGHSFQSLEDSSVVNYLLTSIYSPSEEFGLNPLDPNLGLNWPLPSPLLSDKDHHAPSLALAMELEILPT
jgi:dTDP-4-dehydrorhamnose 3,5-epimerase